MKLIAKFFINLFLRFFNLEIVSKDRQNITYSFDFDYQSLFGPFEKVKIFDVGANAGQSINRFKSIFKNSIIHSFEPDPKAFNAMNNKYGHIKDVFLNREALSNYTKTKKFKIYEHSTDNSFYRKTDEIPKSEIDVKTNTLDNYIALNLIDKIDIIKIDTQSYNKEILEGAKVSLQKKIFKIIEIEISLGNYYEYKNTFGEIEKYLENYQLAGINKSGSLHNNNRYTVDIYYTAK
jgi:FkbM family methyltransferase